MFPCNRKMEIISSYLVFINRWQQCWQALGCIENANNYWGQKRTTLIFSKHTLLIMFQKDYVTSLYHFLNSCQKMHFYFRRFHHWYYASKSIVCLLCALNPFATLSHRNLAFILYLEAATSSKTEFDRKFASICDMHINNHYSFLDVIERVDILL